MKNMDRLTKQDYDELICICNSLMTHTLECLSFDDSINGYISTHNADNQDEDEIERFGLLINDIYLDYLWCKQKYNFSKIFNPYLKEYISFVFIDRDLTTLYDTYKDMIYSFASSNKEQLGIALSYYPQSNDTTYRVLLRNLIDLAYKIQSIHDPDAYNKEILQDVLDEDHSRQEVFSGIFEYISEVLEDYKKNASDSHLNWINLNDKEFSNNIGRVLSLEYEEKYGKHIDMMDEANENNDKERE